jgi:hypothetical protein
MSAPSPSDLPAWKFKEVSKAQIQAVDALFCAESLLRTLSEISLAGLLGGGVLFRRKGFSLQSSSKALYADAWMRFIRELTLQLWKYGFCGVVCVPHPTLKATPHCIDPHQVRIHIHTNVVGQNQYIFTKERDPEGGSVQAPFLGKEDALPTTGLGHVFLDEPIPGVIVLEMDPPDRYGMLQSKATFAWRERQFLSHVMRAEAMAVSGMANPLLVVEKNQVKFRPDLQPAGTVGLQNRTGQAAVDHAQRLAERNHGPAVVEAALLNAGHQIQQTHTRNQFGTFAQDLALLSDELGDPAATHLATFAAFGDNAPMTQRLRLREEETGHTHTQPREPQHLLDILIGYEERLGGLWGVPRSMFAHTQGGHGTDDPNGREMFKAAQRQLRQIIIPMLTNLFRHIYSAKHHLDIVALNTADTAAKASEETDMEIVLPGMPPFEILREWWLQGVLKFEAYRDYLANMYSMPTTDFHEEPQLTLQELNGIKPEAKAATPTDSTQSGVVKETAREEQKVNPKTGHTTKITTKVTESSSEAKAQAPANQKKRKKT